MADQGQCIMKERPLQKVEAGCGAASAALRCAGLRSATAALRRNCGGGSGAKGLQESIGQSGGAWDFYLRGKRHVSTNDRSAPRAHACSPYLAWIPAELCLKTVKFRSNISRRAFSPVNTRLLEGRSEERRVGKECRSRW